MWDDLEGQSAKRNYSNELVKKILNPKLGRRNRETTTQSEHRDRQHCSRETGMTADSELQREDEDP